MTHESDIFSLQIVSADFYMEKPKLGLDPCSSEFRGRAIKKVPIVRIFGSNTTGQKTCMHVHGVFPYLYIPYDKKDFESVDKAIYLVASSIDKAINISLGQTTSDSLHVFKIQMVKGIPMYGYHRNEHQYLKIYMLNPRFVKRTANLLQNGAIMGRMFQPHESHVPYILQFFIDYNLFGMSFIHVPSDVLKFRSDMGENDLPPVMRRDKASIYNKMIKKQSICKLELDICSRFILNRFQNATQTGANANPGIEAIWHDERVRRQQLSGEFGKIPPLEALATQQRDNIIKTESEIFFLTVLKSKLGELEQSPDLTLNSSIQVNKFKKKTFNLQKLIANAVYPEECSKDFELTNASFIEDHTFNNSAFCEQGKKDNEPLSRLKNVSSDPIVNEELVLSLTQTNIGNQSLYEPDMELLDVMQQLEERESLDIIDLDSTLAPFSDNNELDNTKKLFDETLQAEENDKHPCFRENDSDDEALNDFTIIMEDVDEVISKISTFSQSSSKASVSQCDGADDVLLTPKRPKINREQVTPNTPVTPKKRLSTIVGSPKALKTPSSAAKKYAPLPLIVQSRVPKNNIDEIETSLDLRTISRKADICKSSKNCLKSKSLISKKNTNMEKTHITCNLRSSHKKTERRLRVYESSKYAEADLQLLASTSKSDIREPTRHSSVAKYTKYDTSSDNGCILEKHASHKSFLKNETKYVGEEDGTCREYEVNTKNKDASLMKKCRVRIKRLQLEHISRAIEEKLSNGSEIYENINNSVINNVLDIGQSECLNFSQNHHSSNVVITAITPLMKLETYDEVYQNYKTYSISDAMYEHPFYSNYADVTHKKEVGHTVLCIPSKSLKDVDYFQSIIPNIIGFKEQMKNMLNSLDTGFGGTDRSREILSSEKRIVISPYLLPPTKEDMKQWIKSAEMSSDKKTDFQQGNGIDEDSPIKIRRQKVAMLLESIGSNEDLDCSGKKLSLTPLTPTVAARDELLKKMTKVDKNMQYNTKVSLSQKIEEVDMSSNLEDHNEQYQGLLTTENEFKASEKESIDNSSSNETMWSALGISTVITKSKECQSQFDTSFGISIATLNNTYGFKLNLENLQQAKSDIKLNYLTILSLEVFVTTREDYLPDPRFDPVTGIFYAIESNTASSLENGIEKTSGCIVVSDIHKNNIHCKNNVDTKIVDSEHEAFMNFVALVEFRDPDIFVGYEIEMSSWGYITERAKYLNINIMPLLSRIPSEKARDLGDEDRDALTDLEVDTKFCGRILLDVWRLMRSEIALTSYTFENVMYHILHRRCPLHTNKNLTNWFREPRTRWIVSDYYFDRVWGTVQLLNQLDLIGRTSEMAKLIGIQFYEVLCRGSQFRVESMMLRIAKPRNFVPLSPSVMQRAHMRAPEYLPLILEPQSRFYPDPVIVLDFQSLYPSIIMAYNYCFTTCLGRVEHLGQSTPFEFGASQLRVSPTLFKELMKRDMVTVSPCGAVFVKRNIREGVLPRMLSEVLDTRQMVKQSMKLHKSNTALQRILHSRQLGLKLIANVTYGYTAANFSGRMPCVEVGDSVVSKGRETLERAIKLVEGNREWNVKVVYGDTDSLFVVVPGKSREEAFRIGAEIANQVTQDNPHPIKLKLEKVYQPCILQTKKRYVGYMYETLEQMEPVFEAKGIETVRRDGCPAAAKILEKSIKILFETTDMSLVKSYVCRQFTKLLCGKANIQDLIFAKEFRGLNGYKSTACVPALELTRKWIQTDPRRIPRRGERVPFLVTNGPPGLPLIKLVRSPYDVLTDEGLKINAIYYITKAIIPPLNRCLLLAGADVNEWFTQLPRKILITPALSSAGEIITTNLMKRSTISQYFSSTNCLIECGRQTQQGVCSNCALDGIRCLVVLEEKISKLQRGYHLTEMICQTCSGRLSFTDCSSLDCPVLYMLEMKRRELYQITHINHFLELKS